MRFIRCNRCGNESDATVPATIAGAEADLCPGCLAYVTAEWRYPLGLARGARPPVHGVHADVLDPENADRRAAADAANGVTATAGAVASDAGEGADSTG